jgi:hypothetical protein
MSLKEQDRDFRKFAGNGLRRFGCRHRLEVPVMDLLPGEALDPERMLFEADMMHLRITRDASDRLIRPG